MARLFTGSSYDLNTLSFYDIFNRQPTITLLKNQTELFAGVPTIVDKLTYNYKNAGISYQAVFYGNGLEKPGTSIDPGTVTSLAFTTIDATPENSKLVFITDFKNSLSNFLNAGLSPSAADDISLLSSIFSTNDSLIGSAYDDTLYGFVGDDIIIPNGGNDKIEGGLGFDSVAYTDKPTDPTGWQRGEFNITKSGESIIATDTIPGRLGNDTLTSIEKIVFQDVSILFDTEGNAGKGYRIYEAAFNRKPDAGGLGYWIAQLDKGATLKSVAEGFLGSAEFKALYGSSTTNAAFVDSLYKNILDRAGEKGGVDYWTGQLNSGVSRADVLVGFSESAENKAGVIGSIQNGIEYKEWLG